MATHSSILAWRIPQREEPGGLYTPWGHKESDTTEQLIYTYTATIQNILEMYILENILEKCF